MPADSTLKVTAYIKAAVRMPVDGEVVLVLHFAFARKAELVR